MGRHAEITESSILADFVNEISSNEYATAFSLLHPKLRSAWTRDRFTNDWTTIKNQIGDAWGPEATGSFSGTSPQGAYEQATYKLSTDYQSISSVELVSMQTDEGTRIGKAHVRVPEAEPQQAKTKELTDQFVNSMLSKDFDAASQLFSSAHRTQYPPQVLQQLASVLGGSVDATARSHYRLCANTVWYDAVRLTPTTDPATFLEIVISTDTGTPEIVSLSFKGRTKM
ncbi:MAG: hypothetical protein U1E05_04850 [Patescibacteria group bacterium]|nr:hypothetical protein [Patescibacteria group bacterium]